MLKATSFRFSKSLTPRMPSEMGAGWDVTLLGLSMMLTAALNPVRRFGHRLEVRLVWIWTGHRVYKQEVAVMAWLATFFCLITAISLTYGMLRLYFQIYFWFVNHFMP